MAAQHPIKWDHGFIGSVVRHTPPIAFLCVYAGVFLASLIIGAVFPEAHLLSTKVIPRTILFGVSMLPLLFLAAHIFHWQQTREDVRRIGAMYLQNVVLFAIMYAFQVILSEPGEVAISNIDNPYHTLESVADRILEGLGTFLDCVYFSVVTSTTLGYGDMAPMTRLVRTAAVIQVLTSVWLVSIALGRAMGKQKN